MIPRALVADATRKHAALWMVHRGLQCRPLEIALAPYDSMATDKPIALA